MKQKVIGLLKRYKTGTWLYYAALRLRNGEINVDLAFPNLINIETASVCNLRCNHCPSHSSETAIGPRQFGFLDYELFLTLMDEIDASGVREISLHKDGEPLLHPKITDILRRVKKVRNHHVYLTTNGHKLTTEACRAILESKIDVLNVSIGAATEKSYSRIRGRNLNKVVQNVDRFLAYRKKADFKTKVLVQIIDLNDTDMKHEIQMFKSFWESRDVEVQVWPELTWGFRNARQRKTYRYPCFSLWNSFTINSDGLVSACCMDWNQSLIVGDTNIDTIQTIWQAREFSEIRQSHRINDYKRYKLCVKCNYWEWQPMLGNYEF